jgi:hypothetical protein
MNTKKTKFIAVLEIAGGLIGITHLYILSRQHIEFIHVYIYYILILLTFIFLLAIYAGIKLWNETPIGVKLSKIVQAIQIVKITSPFIFYQLFLGASFYVGNYGGKPDIMIWLGTNWGLFIREETIPFGFGVNLLAIWAFLHLRKLSTEQWFRSF